MFYSSNVQSKGRSVLHSSAPEFLLETSCKNQLGIVVPPFCKTVPDLLLFCVNIS